MILKYIVISALFATPSFFEVVTQNGLPIFLALSALYFTIIVPMLCREPILNAAKGSSRDASLEHWIKTQHHVFTSF